MPGKVEFSKLVPIEKLSEYDKIDTEALREMAEDAQQYLRSFKWCKGVEKRWFGWGVGGICAVFLFEIIPASQDVDSFLWIVIGDLPPAYLVTDNISNYVEALETYVELMQEWVNAVKQGKSIEQCIPVNAPPTHEYADLLERRLNTIRQEFLPKQNS